MNSISSLPTEKTAITDLALNDNKSGGLLLGDGSNPNISVVEALVLTSCCSRL